MEVSRRRRWTGGNFPGLSSEQQQDEEALPGETPMFLSRGVALGSLGSSSSTTVTSDATSSKLIAVSALLLLRVTVTLSSSSSGGVKTAVASPWLETAILELSQETRGKL